MNIRAAKAAHQDVTREVHHQPRQRSSNDLVVWEAPVQEGRVILGANVHEGDARESQSIHPAVSALVEPCFVNPSSLAAVKVLLRHVGQCAGVAKYGGNKREWLAVTCDGVPYMLLRKAIQEARLIAQQDSLSAVGWVDSSKLLLKDLKTLLHSRNLPVRGNKAELLARVEHINGPILAQHQCLS